MPEQPSLAELAHKIGPIPHGVDMATALIALTDPDMLLGATNKSFIDVFKAELRSRDDLPKALEQHYEDVLQRPSTRAARREAREILERALASQQNAAEEHHLLGSELRLAREVDERRLKLSRPMRVVSTLVCAAAFATPMSVISYKTTAELNRQAHAKTDAEQIGFMVVIDGVVAATGGLIGRLIGLSGFSLSAAQRRAKKIMAKAEFGHFQF